MKVEIENLTRSTLIFPAFKAAEKKGEPAVPDTDRDIVVGDRNNTKELFDAKGVKPSRKHPLCVVVVDQSQIDGMDPVVRRVFDACISGDPNRKLDGRPAPLAPSLRVRQVA